jgi:hypothetical protein
LAGGLSLRGHFYSVREGTLSKSFNSRTLHFGESRTAEMVGTTRSRESFFTNRFREMRFVDYDGSGLRVHSSLLNVVLHD